MTLLEYCRNKAFWLMDSLRGGEIRQALQQLERIEGGQMSDTEVDRYQQGRLEKLLKHAMLTVPRCRTMTSLELKDWPVTNKDSYRSNYDMSISTSFNKESLIRMSTSGSTGTPFICYQNLGKKRHVNAEVLFYNGQTGYKIGCRIIYLRSVVREISKSQLMQFAQNIYLLNCTDLSDQGIKDKLDFIRRYTKHSPAMLMGYSSTLDAFRKYFDQHGYESAKGCHLLGVVGGSTMLYDNTRLAIERAFDCKCFSRYANEENGFLGQDGIENNVFLMNRANYVTEILKMDKDEPVDNGGIGRIVVTDLFNYAMPMIRYDTGDVGTWTTIENHGVRRRAIGSFGGRVVDMVFNSKGEAVSPHSISTAMWKYQQVEQYQFAQVGLGQYEIRLNLKEESLNEVELIADLKRVVGFDAVIFVRYVDEIPVLASGKRRYIVNETS